MRPNPQLYKDFPVEIRQLYGDVAQVRSLHERHDLLRDFVELTLTYLASLTLSDYRSRSLVPDPKVEGMIKRERTRPLTLGRLLGLFRAATEAIPDPLIPPAGQFEGSSFEMLNRFVAAFEALKEATAGHPHGPQPAEIDVALQIERGLERGVEFVGWWDGWSRLVEYRNRVAHPTQYGWPTRSEGYWEAMTPLLHDAVVDLLTDPVVIEAVLDHPLGSLTFVTDTEFGLSHAVVGEDHGVWFDEKIVIGEPVSERWGNSGWKAETASSFILDRDGDGDGPGWSIRALLWDLRYGFPPELTDAAGDSLAAPRQQPAATSERRRTPAAGIGMAPGTCGEFAQGVLPDGTPFHVTCPVNKSTSVEVTISPASRFSVVGLLDEHSSKLSKAIDGAAREFGLDRVEVSVKHSSDIDVGKGMGSSTADVLAGIRAVAAAVGRELDPATEGRLATAVESSDGSMYPGIAAVNHRTGELVRSWNWYPEFVIVMLVPHDVVDTPSIRFDGQELLASDYEDLLLKMDAAIDARDTAAFAAQSTRSAALNKRFLLNPYFGSLLDRLDRFGALGLNVGHTGTVCGLLFDNSDEGRDRAGEACFAVRRNFPELKDVKVVTTPYCAARSAEEGADEAGGTRNGEQQGD